MVEQLSTLVTGSSCVIFEANYSQEAVMEGLELHEGPTSIDEDSVSHKHLSKLLAHETGSRLRTRNGKSPQPVPTLPVPRLRRRSR